MSSLRLQNVRDIIHSLTHLASFSRQLRQLRSPLVCPPIAFHPEISRLCLPSAERPPQPPGEGGLTAETASRCEVSIVGETLEDMSLSSSSSLDKNDSSQEYMDDFDNLGEQTAV